MSHARSMARVHERLRSKQGEPSFTYFGNDYACVVNSYSRRTSLEMGGREVEADIVFFVRKDLFLVASDQVLTGASETSSSDNRPYPAAGKKIQFCGRTFRIDAVHDPLPHSLETTLQLACTHWAK